MDFESESESLSESESELEESAVFAGVGAAVFAFFAAGLWSEEDEEDESPSESESEEEEEEEESAALRLVPLCESRRMREIFGLVSSGERGVSRSWVPAARGPAAGGGDGERVRARHTRRQRGIGFARVAPRTRARRARARAARVLVARGPAAAVFGGGRASLFAGGAPGLHEHVGHLGEVRVEVLRLAGRERAWGLVSIGRGRPRARRRGACRRGASLSRATDEASAGGSAIMSLVSRGAFRERTVLDGVMFLALASAFIAESVSFRPFASRYASTAGTRSAALAVIVSGCGGRIRFPAAAPSFLAGAVCADGRSRASQRPPTRTFFSPNFSGTHVIMHFPILKLFRLMVHTNHDIALSPSRGLS